MGNSLGELISQTRANKCFISSKPQLQPHWTTGLWVAMSVLHTLSPGRCPSILATITVGAPSSTTSGSSLQPTAGKSASRFYFSLSAKSALVKVALILIPLCFAYFSPYSQIAILGDHHIWVHEGTEQYMSVDAIYWHQSYDYTTLDYDIMLMKLAHKVDFNDNVKPIALPRGCPNAGDMCTVSGWGNIYSDDGELLLNITTTTTKACCSLEKTDMQSLTAFWCLPVAIPEEFESAENALCKPLYGIQ